MNRTTAKTLSLLTLAAFPFFAGCTSPSERIHKNIQAGVPVNRADVFATLKERESPWAMHGIDGKVFSLFEYAVKKGELDLLNFCLADKSTPELAEAQTGAYVESVIAKISVDDDAEQEVRICEKIWNAGLALAMKPKLEAKQKQVEEKRASLEKERKDRERINAIKAEKQEIFQRMREEILPSEQKLSASEQSRGRRLLDAFGEEHMPLLTEKCGAARRKHLEAEANFEELIKALKAENIALKTNNIYQAAEKNWLSLAADYWQLRYVLTDFYSQFKIGVITSDELAAKDEELAELFSTVEKI